MSASGSSERRSFYRLQYPEAERPRLFFENMEFKVAELSESGMRIVLGGWRLKSERPMLGWIKFKDGLASVVEGKVLRIEEGEAIVHLTLGVSLKRMLAEQRRLIRLYPILFERTEVETEKL